MSNQVGDSIIRNFDFLRQLAHAKSKDRRWNMVRNATRDQLLAIVEICCNIRSSDFILDRRQKKKLQPHANFVRKLSSSKNEEFARRVLSEHEKQNGGALPSLLIPVLLEAARYFIDND